MARNVTLPIIPRGLRQADSLQSWRLLKMLLQAGLATVRSRASHESSGLSFCGSTIALPRPVGTFAKCSSAFSNPHLPISHPTPRLNYTIASPVRDIFYDLKRSSFW